MLAMQPFVPIGFEIYSRELIGATSPAALIGAPIGDFECHEFIFNGLSWILDSINQARL